MSGYPVGHAVAADEYHEGDAWTAYTPAWTVFSGTNPGLGNATIAGKWKYLGRNIIVVMGKLLLGSSTTIGSGVYMITVPAAASSDSQLYAIGAAYLFDAGSRSYPASCHFNNGTQLFFESTSGGVSNSSPFTFGSQAGDSISWTITYELATPV